MEEAAYKGEDEEQEKEFVLKDILSVRNYTKLHGDLQLLRFEVKSGDEALKAEINALRTCKEATRFYVLKLTRCELKRAVNIAAQLTRYLQH